MAICRAATYLTACRWPSRLHMRQPNCGSAWQERYILGLSGGYRISLILFAIAYRPIAECKMLSSHELLCRVLVSLTVMVRTVNVMKLQTPRVKHSAQWTLDSRLPTLHRVGICQRCVSMWCIVKKHASVHTCAHRIMMEHDRSFTFLNSRASRTTFSTDYTFRKFLLLIRD
jgi:hypothetical protein